MVRLTWVEYKGNKAIVEHSEVMKASEADKRMKEFHKNKNIRTFYAEGLYVPQK